MACDLGWLRERHRGLGIEATIPIEPRPFQERPLLRFPGGSFCPMMPQFVAEWSTLGLYYRLFEAWRAGSGGNPRNRFTTFWGEVIEAYVDSLFEAVYPPTANLARRLWFDDDVKWAGGASKLPPDVMLDCGDTLVLFEVTTSRLTRDSLYMGDAVAIRRDLDKAVVRKARQLRHRVTDFMAGQFSIGATTASAFGRFQPVVVVWQELPLSTPNLRYCYGHSPAPRPADRRVSPARILRLTECEGLLALAYRNESIVDALCDARWEFTSTSFADFRHQIGRPLRSMEHPVLAGARQRVTDLVRRTLLPEDDQR